MFVLCFRLLQTYNSTRNLDKDESLEDDGRTPEVNNSTNDSTNNSALVQQLKKQTENIVNLKETKG